MAVGNSLQDTQRLMMREVAHSIISNSMCHFHSCSQTMGFRAWTQTSREMDGTFQIGNFPLRGLRKTPVMLQQINLFSRYLEKWTDHSIKVNVATFPHKEDQSMTLSYHFFDKSRIMAS